jgi:hypothetical protein
VEKKMNKLDIIRLASDAYDEEGTVMRSLRGEPVGDTLATFIEREIAAVYDPEADTFRNLSEVHQALHRARDEILKVAKAIMAESSRRSMLGPEGRK